MDAHLFIQQLLELPEDAGRIYIVQHAPEITDPAPIGALLREEAYRQRDIQPLAALKLAELLIFFGQYLHHPPSHAMGLHSKGVALSAIGLEQAAMDSMDTAGAMFLQIGDEVNWARTRIGWIFSCFLLGRVEEALAMAARARALLEQHRELYWVCAIDHNTAIIYTQIGQYQKALELYARLLAIYPTLTDRGENFIHRAIAMVEMNQARIRSWLGDFEQARRLLLKARSSLLALGQTNIVSRVESSLAMLDYVQGYYGSALRRYYQVRDTMLQHKLDNTMTFAFIMLHIASCLVKLNRTQEACQIGAEAVVLCRTLGISVDTADVLREYANVLMAASRPKDAASALDEASALFNQGGLVHYATTTRLQRAELLLEMGAFMAAYAQSSSLKEYFDAQGLASRSASAYLIMAEALIKQARKSKLAQELAQDSPLLHEATSICEQVTTLTSQHNLQEEAYRSLYLRGQLTLLQGDLVEAEKSYSAAIEQVEQMLDDLVLDLLPAFLHKTWGIYEDMIVLCLQQGQVERAFNRSEERRSLALRQYLNMFRQPQREMGVQEEALSSLQARNAAVLRVQNELSNWQSRYRGYSAQLAALESAVSTEIDREVLKAELQRCEAKISELFERLHLSQIEIDNTSQAKQKSQPERNPHAVHGMDISQLRQHLAPDQLLLAYFLYQGRLVIFAVTQEDVIIHENPDGMMQLERFLPPLFAYLEPGGWPDVENPPQFAIRRVLQKLYTLLIAPISSLLPSVAGAITVVPYGPLHSLPFHALHTGSHFLIEDFQINYLPASNLLTHLSTRHTLAPTRSPLIFGYSGNGELRSEERRVGKECRSRWS